MSYRQIAVFLKERGVNTDHTAIYRLLAPANPLLQARDGYALLPDGVLYESRPGCPLRPYRAGCLIMIEKRMWIMPLALGAIRSLWCEAQFAVNENPNHAWIRKLSENLRLPWNASKPSHLQGRDGLELKFQGKVMAMVCKTYNLEREVQKLETAVREVTNSFQNDKEWFSRQQLLIKRRDAELLDALVIPPGASKSEELQECLDGTRREVEELTTRFNSISMS